MEEEIKKRGRGRPRKGEEAPKTAKKPQEKAGWGGKREGAGRKKGVQIKAHPRKFHFSFGVSEQSVRRANELRELTKHDTMPFVDMLESWIEDMAKEYGID